MTRLRIVDGRSSDYVHVPAYVVDEARMEAAVARDERLAHTAVVRQHTRAAVRALAGGHYASAGMWLVELERLNEREANRARAIGVAQEPCPDGITRIGHGKAA